jgi:hypothetical protein
MNTEGKIYYLAMNDEGPAELFVRPFTFLTPDMMIDYRLNIQSISKGYDSSNFLARMIVYDSKPETSAEYLLFEETYTTAGAKTKSWSANSPPSGYITSAVNLRFVKTVTAGNPTFEMTAQGPTSIGFTVANDGAFSVTLKVYGTYIKDDYTGSAAEFCQIENILKSIGAMKEFENRFITEFADAYALAETLIDVYGDPLFLISCEVRYNPLIEIGDKLLVYEINTSTQSICSVTEISYKYNASSARIGMTLSLADIGYDFLYPNWDRHNILNSGTMAEGIDDLTWDFGYIWDSDIPYNQTEDTTDYENLISVEVGV